MNKKLGAASVGALAAVVLAVPFGGAASPAKSIKVAAAMAPKQVVTPANKAWQVPAAAAKAKASFTGTVSADGRSLSWRISYAGLGKPSTVIADIHSGKAGSFGPILVRLCTACTPVQKGTAKLKAGVATQFTLRTTWVTLITPQYPNGIVRGQIQATSL